MNKFLYKPVTYKFDRRPIQTAYRSQIFSVDLADYSRDPIMPGYIVVCVDNFTRKAWGCKTSSKTETAITQALNKIFEDSGYPEKIHSDQESAIVHNKMLRHHGIEVYHTTTNIGAAIAERCIRTIKEKIQMKRDESKHKNWRSYVEEAFIEYNSQQHSYLKKTPNEAWNNPEIGTDAQQRHLSKARSEPKKKLSVGDVVITVKRKTLFEKGYTQRFNTSPHKIVEIIETVPTMYILDNGERKYAQELQKIEQTAHNYLIEMNRKKN